MGEERSGRRRRRSRRRSGITDLAFTYPVALGESLTERFGATLRRGRLDSADILELLGDDEEEERVASVVAMLRRSSDEEISELLRIGQAAVLQVSRERAGQE